MAVKVVSRKLKGLIVEHGMTIRKLSKMMGISETTLSRRINGRSEWYFDEISFLTDVFGFPYTKDVFPELHNSVSRVG